MIKKTQLKPIAAALGTTFAVTLAVSPLVNAADNPFAVTEFKSGYMVAAGHGEGGLPAPSWSATNCLLKFPGQTSGRSCQ